LEAGGAQTALYVLLISSLPLFGGKNRLLTRSQDMKTVREVLRTKHLDEYTGKSLKRRGVPEFDFSNRVRENKKSLKDQHPTRRKDKTEQGWGYQKLRSMGGSKVIEHIKKRLSKILR